MHDHMAHSLGSVEWVSVLLSLLFASGAVFYIFRFFSPAYLKSVNGYHDRENEFWHGACMLGMVACLTPAWLPVSPLVWTIGFAVGTAWYLFRAFTYGKRLTYNKQWYDFAHAAMTFGMWWMFAQPVSHWLVSAVFAAYWTWFGSYYVYRLSLDFRKPHWLGFGQDGAHFVMSAVMLVMTLMPAAFSGHDSHHQHHMASAPAQELCQTPQDVLPSAVVLASDVNFDSAVKNQSGTTVVLVSGGCVNCATEIPVFEKVAETLAGSGAHFVRLHKDASPKGCAWLSAKQCPAIVIVENGKVTARQDGFADHAAIETFVRQHVGN